MKSQYPIEPKANGADANKPRKTAAATADATPDSTRGFASESEYQWFIQVTPNVLDNRPPERAARREPTSAACWRSG